MKNNSAQTDFLDDFFGELDAKIDEKTAENSFENREKNSQKIEAGARDFQSREHNSDGKFWSDKPRGDAREERSREENPAMAARNRESLIFAQNNFENPQNSANLIPEFSVSEATNLFNQIFETATPRIKIVGEVANFKISQGKWVFFDLKDENSSLSCFMSVFNLRAEIENGMKISAVARPNITKWGKFSLTIQTLKPVGTGSIKRAFDLLREKLEKEGIFDVARKRILPEIPRKIGVISSVDAAGYKDFIKILASRLGGAKISVANVQVQGEKSADQIISALKFFNNLRDLPEVICILRGGGSRDDLAAFDDEKLVREIANSRVPILTGIGHEIDTTLADLAADFRASTPSNAAEILVPARREILSKIDFGLENSLNKIDENLARAENNLRANFAEISRQTDQILTRDFNEFSRLFSILQSLNPREILRRGYAILREKSGEILTKKPQISDIIIAENLKYLIESEVKNVREKS